MSRILSLAIIIVLSLLPVMTSAAPAHKQRSARWHGYGFLPGYRQPPNNTVPVYGVNRPRGGPYYTPSYWYNGDRYYFGQPGFYRGRQLWSVLDLDADRARVELRVAAQAESLHCRAAGG